MLKCFKYFISLFLLLALQTVNVKALATEESSYSFNEGIRINELLSSPQAKVPSPEVKSFLSKVDFTGGKTKMKDGEKTHHCKQVYYCNNSSQVVFSYFVKLIPAFILHGVFRI